MTDYFPTREEKDSRGGFADLLESMQKALDMPAHDREVENRSFWKNRRLERENKRLGFKLAVAELNEMAAGVSSRTMAKAFPDQDADRAKRLPNQTDTAAQISRARHLLREGAVRGDLTLDQASRIEARINHEEAAYRSRSTGPVSRAERQESVVRATAILRDLVSTGKLDPTQVATYEAQIHALETSLGRRAGDVPDPMRG